MRNYERPSVSGGHTAEESACAARGAPGECFSDPAPGTRKYSYRYRLVCRCMRDTSGISERLLPPEDRRGETAREQLEKMGILPEDIDLVLLSHLDVDHTCALRDFAGRAKRTVCSELEYFYSCRYVYKARQVWDTWMPYITNEEDRLCYRASVLGPAGRGFDIFGDDSVICIYTPGHTDGNFTTLVNQSPSDRFKEHGDGRYGGEFAVIAGDTAFSRRNLDEMSVPGYGFDRRMQLRSIEFLKKLEADRNCRAILFSHSTPDNSEIILK